MSRKFILKVSASAIFISVLLLGAWIGIPGSAAFPERNPAFYPGVLAGGSVLMVILTLILVLESHGLRRAWLQYVSSRVGLPTLNPEGILRRIGRSVPDPLEWMVKPLLHSRIGRVLQAEWIDSKFGKSGSRYLLLLLTAAFGGYLLGVRIGGPMLGFSFALMMPLLPRTVISNRARTERQRFGEQLPQLLDLLASGMAAGMSFTQAVAFSQDELPEPTQTEVKKLAIRLKLGWSVDDALRSMNDEREEEGLNLAVEGIILQRQFGGDMVRMLGEISELLRERLELEREIRAVTTQGRLSGMVIAGLVPASAAFLLAFNPSYIDILFETFIGQVLVVVTLVLQLAGWVVISRLMRISF